MESLRLNWPRCFSVPSSGPLATTCTSTAELFARGNDRQRLTLSENIIRPPAAAGEPSRGGRFKINRHFARDDFQQPVPFHDARTLLDQPGTGPHGDVS